MPFQKGHPNYVVTPEQKARRVDNFKASVRRGENSPNWKGSLASKLTIHEWMKKHIPKPLLCPNCGETKKLELSNVDHNYRRIARDWQWLCRSCHTKYDIAVNGRPKPPRRVG